MKNPKYFNITLSFPASGSCETIASECTFSEQPNPEDPDQGIAEGEPHQ